MLQYIVRFIEWPGKIIIENLEGLGKICNFTGKFLYWFARPPYRVQNLLEQINFVGNKSLFIICLSGSFTGMVMAYQTYFGFKLISVDSW